jgi:hypothetical protein
VLEAAEVLGLVNQERAEARAQPLPDRGVLVEECERRRQQVREVERVRLPAPGLVGGQQRGERTEAGRRRRARPWRSLALRPFDGLDQGREVALKVEFLHEPPDQPARVLAVEDREGRRAAQPGAMPAQEPGAEPMERPGPQLARQRAEGPDEPPAQLVRGGPREREGQDGDRVHPFLLHQPLDPVGQDAGLAAARATREQQRPRRVCHGRALGRVERG